MIIIMCMYLINSNNIYRVIILKSRSLQHFHHIMNGASTYLMYFCFSQFNTVHCKQLSILILLIDGFKLCTSVSKGSTLPTEPQPLSFYCHFFLLICSKGTPLGRFLWKRFWFETLLVWLNVINFCCEAVKQFSFEIFTR